MPIGIKESLVSEPMAPYMHVMHTFTSVQTADAFADLLHGKAAGRSSRRMFRRLRMMPRDDHKSGIRCRWRSG